MFMAWVWKDENNAVALGLLLFVVPSRGPIRAPRARVGGRRVSASAVRLRIAPSPRPAAGSSRMRQLLPPGHTPESICLALPFNTLPNSGSLAIMVRKCLASLSVMCGGKGGTFGSV